jgi:DNA-binding MarR family transcriptional regulator
MKALNPRQMLTLGVLGVLSQDRGSTRQVSNALGADYDAVGVTMRRLREAGLIVRTTTRPYVWWLTGSGEAYRRALLEVLGVNAERAPRNDALSQSAGTAG